MSVYHKLKGHAEALAKQLRLCEVMLSFVTKASGEGLQYRIEQIRNENLPATQKALAVYRAEYPEEIVAQPTYEELKAGLDATKRRLERRDKQLQTLADLIQEMAIKHPYCDPELDDRIRSALP